jgi:hypothetical protein
MHAQEVMKLAQALHVELLLESSNGALKECCRRSSEHDINIK